MEPTRDRRAKAEQKQRRKLQQHVGLGRMVILVLIAVSLVNQLLLLLKVNYHFLVSMAVPYYLNWLAVQLGANSGVTALKVVGALVTIFMYLAFAFCWMQSARRREYLATVMYLYMADTVLLVLFAFALLNNPFSCLLEILLHLAVLAVLFDAKRNGEQLQRMMSRKRTQPGSANRRPAQRPRHPDSHYSR